MTKTIVKQKLAKGISYIVKEYESELPKIRKMIDMSSILLKSKETKKFLSDMVDLLPADFWKKINQLSKEYKTMERIRDQNNPEFVASMLQVTSTVTLLLKDVVLQIKPASKIANKFGDDINAMINS